MILKYLISFRQSKQLGFGVGVLSVPAYPLRCRGGLNGGEIKKGLGFCAQSRSGYKKPQALKPCVLASAVALLVTGLVGLLPSAPSLSASNETCKLGASVFFAVASLFDPCSRLSRFAPSPLAKRLGGSPKNTPKQKNKKKSGCSGFSQEE